MYMYRKYFTTSIFCLLAATSFSQIKFAIKGKITEVEPQAKMFLYYRKNGAPAIDSTITKKGEFSFRGTISRPVKAWLELKGKHGDVWDTQQLFLEKGMLSVRGKNVRTARIEGGPVQGDFNKLSARLKPLETRQNAVSMSLSNRMNSSDTTGSSVIRDQLTKIYSERNIVLDNFIRNNPSSYVSLDILLERKTHIEPVSFGPLFEVLSPTLKNSVEGKRLRELLRIAGLTDIGKPFIDFTQQTIDGKSFKLSSLRGKYILIDFWASWCGPCRAENPNMLKAYNAYKDKNFEIVAISLDDKKQAWKSAVDQDALPWIQVSDLRGFNNEVAEMYGIKAIPRNFLIDPSGKIIAKNLRGDELDKVLGSIFSR